MDIRNIAIIAHVDHGKTTLVDHLLRQAGTFSAHADVSERVMDSMDLERERGITIAAKNASVDYQGTRINIVDTPGHADFGGEVERIMSMVDGALLLVDAAEGPLPQTRFVLERALAQNLRIILVINKVDRPDATADRVSEVVNQVFDLFVSLGASDEQADFPIIYACARDGWATDNTDDVNPMIDGDKKGDLRILFDQIVKTVAAPTVEEGDDFKLLVANLAYSEYVGQLGIGRILQGKVQRNQTLYRLGADDTREKFQASRIYTYAGMSQQEREDAAAGDIVIIAGTDKVEIGDTITSSDSMPAMPRIEVEKPTLGVIFSVNTSPFSGQDGEAIQSRKLREILEKECRTNVALRLEDTDQPDQLRLLGRGELQFAIIIEQMRRAGYELMVGRPTVLFRTNEAGEREEPQEHCVLDLPQDFAGDVTDMLQRRKGILSSYETVGTNPDGSSRVRLTFEIPSRGLLGIQSSYLTATRGQGLFNTEFAGWMPYAGELPYGRGGALVSDRNGETVEYALRSLEERGILFVKPGVKVYEGMIIGENAREQDMNVNPCKEKKLTNVRSVNSDVLVHLQGVREMTLERCIEWIDEDEWIEITPETVRLRKKVLPKNQRSVHRADRIS